MLTMRIIMIEITNLVMNSYRYNSCAIITLNNATLFPLFCDIYDVSCHHL